MDAGRPSSGSLLDAPGRPHLSLLRSFELTLAADRIEVPVTVQRLLALIALHGRPLRRLFVAGTLWPDSPEERAVASLRSALWRLRQCDVPVIETRGPLIGLGPDVVFDVTELVWIARSLEDQAPVGSLASLQARFDDELLPDWYDDWVTVWRERWRHVRLNALEAVALRLSESGSYFSAVEAALAAVRAEPIRESAHRALISVHLAAGNEGEAVRQYETYRRLLHDELGVEPSPRMQALLSG